MFYCCVPSCSNTSRTAKMLRFPYLEEPVFNIWISRIGNKKLKELDPQHVYKSYRICDEHFTPQCHFDSSKKTLKLRSLPTLYLPGFNEDPVANSFLPWGEGDVLDAVTPTFSPEHTVAYDDSLPGSSTQTVSEDIVPTYDDSLPGPSAQTISEDIGLAYDDSLHVLSEQTVSDDIVWAYDDPLPGPSTQTVSEDKSLPGSSIRPVSEDNIQEMSPLPSETKPEFKTPKSRKDLHRRLNFLSSVNETRATNLTPKAKKLYHLANNLKVIARNLDKEYANAQTRVARASDFITNENFIKSTVNKTTYKFIMSQLRFQKSKPRARRFSEEDKVFALSLIRNSPRNYRLLQRVFALPSRQTLRNMLNKVPLTCGINLKLMSSMQHAVAKLAKEDKLCTLLFDEISLSPGLMYNTRHDYIEGFEDRGNGQRTPKFADHALVFMVRGIRRKWKQPIAFYFVESSMKTAELVRVIKDVIKAAQDSGLHVVATVCDQLSTNKAAINELMRQTNEAYIRKHIENKNFGFEVGNTEVIPLYDPPHLLKGIRNNMLQKNVQFKWKKDHVQTASWQVFIKAYEGDCPTDPDYRIFYGISDMHIYEDKMKKMKVNLAAQVFSQRVASSINFIVRTDPNLLPAEAEATAEFALFMDKLFDSVNGSTLTPKNGKYLRVAITEKTEHHKFWNEAIKVLNSMKFVKGNEISVPPSVHSWIHTLRGFKYLWEKLKQYNIQFLCPRHINQDPLENFFCKVRSQGVRNVNPTCTHFKNSYTSLIINNFMAPHSVEANCEEDESEGAIDNLKAFLFASYSTEEELTLNVLPDCPTLEPVPETDATLINLHNYIAGYVAKKVLKKVGICSTCRSELICCDRSRDEFSLIHNRAYSHKALLCPNTEFNKIFEKYSYNLKIYMDKYCCSENLSLVLKQVFLNDDFKKFTCKEHNVKEMFSLFLVKFYIFVWVKNINISLKGKDEKLKNKKKYGKVRTLACQRYEKFKKRQQKYQKMKQTI